ncbi:MAG: type II toxin-antitoxin system VapC family toxin [Terriglobales bacterium]
MGRHVLILLDTHIVLWLALQPERISKSARAVIDEARGSGTGLAISAMTLVEISTLFGKRRFNLAMSLESFLGEVQRKFVVLPINARTCARMLSLPAGYSKDPADRVIGATALVEGMSLVTADREIRRAKVVRTIW